MDRLRPSAARPFQGDCGGLAEGLIGQGEGRKAIERAVRDYRTNNLVPVTSKDGGVVLVAHDHQDIGMFLLPGGGGGGL